MTTACPEGPLRMLRAARRYLDWLSPRCPPRLPTCCAGRACHALITIGKEEGLTSIYRGLSPALVRQSVYGTIKFGLYYSSKDVAKRLVRQPQKESSLVNLCCAVVAGSVSATLATPTDVIKVRMQSGSMHKGANISWSLLSVGKVVLRHEGIRGLWRGGLPTAQRAALVLDRNFEMLTQTGLRTRLSEK